MNKIFYLDESEYSEYDKFWGMYDKIYVMGGYIISTDQVLNLKNKIDGIKENNKISVDMPIKWNFKDKAIEKIYIDRYGKDYHNELVGKADKIREEILSAIQEPSLNIIIVVSASYKDAVPKGWNFYSECFTNCLQRIGMDLKDKKMSDVQIVLDSQCKDRQNEIHDVFKKAYYEGVDINGNSYFSGPLKNYKIYPTLLSGSDLHSTELQLADIIIGATNYFLQSVEFGKDETRSIRFFTPLLPLFRRDEKGNILRYGILLSRRFEKANKRILELSGN